MVFDRDQYVVVRFVPLGNGRTDKVPLSPESLTPADSGDPANWVSYAVASALAETMGDGYGVGFRFTEADPYVFIDLDHCMDEAGVMSGFAIDTLARFPGAFVEVSNSGRGLHVFGMYSQIPPHKCKRADLGLEVYHTGRFVALGNTAGGWGDAGADITEPLAALIADLMPSTDSGTAAEWTTEPPADYGGPTDDEDLMTRMLAAKASAGSVFGGKASLPALLTGDESALGQAFPPMNSADPYDRSGADAALFAHLAWWTGRDCARMERLARMTPLARGKWDRRDYIEGTILGACARATSYWTRRPVSAPPPPKSSDPSADGIPYQVPHAMIPEIMRGVLYVESLGCAYVPGRGIIKPSAFTMIYGGHRWEINAEAKAVEDAWDVLQRVEGWRVPCVSGPCFRPDLPPGDVIESEGGSFVNVWEPARVTTRQGDPSRLLDLCSRLLPDGRDRSLLLSYMAACVQYPGKKFQWWPVVQGTEGNGKSILARCVEYAVGKRYSHFPNVAEIARSGLKFNAWVYCKLFLALEEVYVPHRRDFLEEFKPIVTNPRIQIERKGVDAATLENYANGMMFTNHLDGVPVTTDGRRYAVFYTAQQSRADLTRDRMDGGYFPDLYDWLHGRGAYAGLGADYGFSVVAGYLSTYPIPPDMDPAGLCNRAPETSSTRSAVEESLGPIEQEIREHISGDEPGFRGGWMSSSAISRVMRQEGMKVTRNRRPAIIAALGYVPHPGLPDGRVHRIVAPDAGRPILYIARGHPAAGLTDPDAIADAYQRAQGVIVAAGR